MTASSEKGAKPSPWARTWHYLSQVTVEPVMFLHAISFLLTTSMYPSFKLEKVCKVGSDWFGNGTSFPDAVCDEMDNGMHEDVQTYVQTTSNTLSVAETYATQVPAFLFMTVSGSWSDRYGRKLMLLLPIVGLLLSNVYISLNVIFFEEMSADLLIFSAVSGLFGAQLAFYVASYASIADVSSGKYRITRIALLDFSYNVGQIVGSELAGVLYNAFGYLGPFLASASIYAVQILYVIVLIKETNQAALDSKEKELEEEKKDPDTTTNPFKLIWQLLKETGSLLTKYRPGHLRPALIVTCLSYFCYMVSKQVGEVQVSYLRRAFEWDDSDEFNTWYSSYLAYDTLIHLPNVLAVMFLSLVCGVTDVVMLAVAAASSVASDSILISVENVQYVYIASAVGLLAWVGHASARAAISKMVVEEEAGKAMAAVGLMQSTGFFIRPSFDFIYNATIEWHPGFVYCIGCTLNIFSVAMLLIIVRPILRRFHHGRKKNDEKQ